MAKLKALVFNVVLLIALLVSFPGNATHIVGGQFGYQHVNGTNYRFNLTVYFDAILGNPGALDPTVRCFIFSKGTDNLIDTLDMPLVTDTGFVGYTTPTCARSDLSTKILNYSALLSLPANKYNDPDGYYITWERCCRNGSITNIIDPGSTGQAFYMEFPAVIKNGLPFINSSPASFKPLKDFGCITGLFSANYGGVDPDNDSLVYKLVAPRAGHSSPVQPILAGPFSAPYAPVSWQTGFSATTQINGLQPLNIDSVNGFLSVIPSNVGLYVFAVSCSEYRNGAKIGEVVREYQLKIYNCPVNYKPVVLVAKGNTPNNYINNFDTVIVQASAGAKLAVKLSGKLGVNQTKNLKFRIDGINFPTGINLTCDGLPPLILSPNSDTINLIICVPQCTPPPNNLPYFIRIIVSDDVCPTPLSDTLLLYIIIIPAPFKKLILKDLGSTTNGSNLSINGTGVLLNLVGIDSTGSEIQFFVFRDNYNNLVGTSRLGVSRLNYFQNFDVTCNDIKAGSINFYVILKSFSCIKPQADTLVFHYLVDDLDKPLVVLTNLPNLLQDKYETVRLVRGQKTEFYLRVNNPDKVSVFGTKVTLPKFVLDKPTTTSETTDSSFKYTFSYQPTCNALADNYPKTAVFTFSDSLCPSYIKQRYIVNFTVEDVNDVLFAAPNVITPNKDGFNDTFTLDNVIPKDKCDDKFQKVEIYGRWGQLVFSSTDRNFSWDAANLPASAYYYVVKFDSQIFKGWVTVLE